MRTWRIQPRLARVALPLFVALAHLPCAHSLERALVMVYPFASPDKNAAAIVTDILRVGISRTGFLDVAEPPEVVVGKSSGLDSDAVGELKRGDFSLEGSVSQNQEGLTIAYRLLENSTGKVIEATTTSVKSENLEQGLESLSAGLGNSMMASFVGATPHNVALLIGLGRFDEAEKRLDSLLASSPTDVALHKFKDEIAKGRARIWADEGRRELASAAKMQGWDALAAAKDSRDSIEAALLLLSESDRRTSLGTGMASFLTEQVLPGIAKGEAKARKIVYHDSEAALKSGQSMLAIQVVEDFEATEGGLALDGPLLEIRRRARSAYAWELSAKALGLARKEEYVLANSLISEAVGFDPYAPPLLSATDRIGRAAAVQGANDRVNEMLRFQGRPDIVFSWTGSCGLGVGGYECGDFTVPLSGSLPGLEVVYGGYFRTSGGVAGALRATVFASKGTQAITTRSFLGNLDSTLFVVDAGVETSTAISVPGLLTFSGGASVDLGAVAARYTATYQAAPPGSASDGFLVAPEARIGLFVEMFASPKISVRVSGSLSGAWIFGFGPVGGNRISMVVRYSPR